MPSYDMEKNALQFWGFKFPYCYSRVAVMGKPFVFLMDPSSVS